MAPMPNLEYKTVSPIFREKGCCLVPTWPSPKAMTSPEVGRFCAAVGKMMPPLVFSSASATLAKIKSPLGETCEGRIE